jgi:L-lactate dehydrogenase complex protein LldG
MTTAREDILRRVRSALRDVPPDERPADVAVERGYRRGTGLSADAVLALFAERVADYRAEVHLVAAADLPAALAAACERHGVRRLVAPADLPDDWRPVGAELVVDDGLDHAALDGVDGVISGCAAACAETGTIALDGGPRQGRRALSLLPDLHLCVVEAGQVVGGVPELVAALAGAARARRPITWISGPSATSDIELDRVEGVHGPRRLEVFLVERQKD